MPLNNNDTYDVSQGNGLNDSDFNLNVGTATQVGILNIGGASQSIDSGGNGQSNTSWISDSGIGVGLLNNNDDYTVDQSNQMLDSDVNLNVGTLNQFGILNIGGVTQDTTSGSNGQSNDSTIYDTGLGVGVFNNNDSYAVGQYNGMADNDLNLQVGNVGQLGVLNFAVVDQTIDSGSNGQTNTSWIDDTGFSFGLVNGNDSYDVGQTNNMYDLDANANGAAVAQAGALNLAGVGQSIDSGGNGQSNSSSISDFGLSLGLVNDNDEYDVDQLNGMADNDQNANLAVVQQLGLGNIAGVDQEISSGSNGQSNSSTIGDFGIGFGVANNNDSYTIGQQNIMFDNDINTNVGVVAQLGFGNVAVIDQDITSGGNGQSNSSWVSDSGLGGFGSNNDAYSVTQANLLADSDSNTNAASATQVLAFNIAAFNQEIVSGENGQSNSSTIDDA